MALINCKECHKEISDKAEICPHCGAKPYKPSGCFVFIAGALVLFGLAGLTSNSKNQNNTPNATDITSLQKPALEETPKEEIAAPTPNTWQYANYDDETSGKKTNTIYLISNNVEQLEFPHQGGTYATMHLRKHPRFGKDVFISTNNGQLHCEYNDCRVSVRFDNGEVTRYRATEPDDSSNTTFFFDNTKKMITSIQKSKKMYVELVFFSQGRKTFEFNTADLDLTSLK